MGTEVTVIPVTSAAVPEECWTTVDGLRMRYLRGGAGPALILLHGLLGYSFSWRFTIPALARRATVYAVDMPGAGCSDRVGDRDCSFRACAGRLLEFARQVGLASFDLLGTSHGGAVAMMAAARARQAGTPVINRLVLVAPVNPWSLHGAGMARFLSRRLVSILFRGLAPRMSVAHDYFLRRLYGDPRRISPGTLEGYTKPFRRPGTFEYGLRVLQTWNEDLAQLKATLPEIADVRVLLIWGTRDAAVDPASAARLRENFRHCGLQLFDGAGHLPYEEVPEQFNRTLIDFLQSPERHLNL
jgi:pimeloyl-ACP methyl ester carboxylesterase